MAEVGDAFVSIVPTMKGAGRTIQSELDGTVGKAGDKAGKRFGAAFKGAMAGGVAAAGAAKAISLLRDSVGEAREAQKVGATTNQIIKTTGGVANVSAAGVAKLAESISNKTGVDDEAIQTGSNLLLTFKNVRNEAGKGNKVFDQATKAAVDLSAAGFGSIDSASKMLGKALNDPIKGVTALSRAGVTFTAQQKEQIKTLVESGDVLGAQKLILAEVQSQVGGVAEASATSGEKLKTTFNNFKESIGTALLPTIDAINGKLIQFFGWLNNNRPVMIALGILVGGVLVGAFVALAVAVVAATWPFLLAGVALAAFAAGFIYAYKHSETFRSIVHALGFSVLRLASQFLSMTSSIAGAWASMLGALAKVPGFGWAKGASEALQGVSDKTGVASDKTAALAERLKQVPKGTDASVKTSDLTKPTQGAQQLGKAVKDIPPTKSSKVSVNDLGKHITEAGNLTKGIDNIKGKSVSVNMNSLSSDISQAKSLKNAIDDLQSKTITIKTNYTSTGTPPRTARGSIVSGATRLIAGEAGPEAIVPLDRPLNQVDPSVRWLAAYAQGKTDMATMRPLSLDSVGDVTAGAPSDLDLSDATLQRLAALVAAAQHRESVGTVAAVARDAGGRRQTAGVLR